MKDELARELLVRVLGTEDETEIAAVLPSLQAMATVKYDEYEGYQPGVKFLESLAGWLKGFELGERGLALQFVLERLVFVSGAEMDRLVSRVYSDILRPYLIAEAASRIDVAPWRVTEVVSSPQFKSLERRTIILGMSDGARLDRLRRSTPLSTEQFYLSTDIPEEKLLDMRGKLRKALTAHGLTGEDSFDSVVIVDDFSASGTTMIRDENKTGDWTGKLPKLNRKLDRLRADGHLSRDARVEVILYMATTQADAHLQESLLASGLSDIFRLTVVYRMPPSLPLLAPADTAYVELLEKYYKPEWASEHTAVGGDRFSSGYGGCALPLVLHHNTPNNSFPTLWRDEIEEPYSSHESTGEGLSHWHALFPRHERHHKDRP